MNRLLKYVFVFILLKGYICYGHDTIFVSYYRDYNYINRITDSLVKINIKNIFVFQTHNKEGEIKSIQSKDSIFSFLIWEDKEKLHILLITEYLIYINTTNINSDMFNFSSLKTCAITEKEINKGLVLQIPIMIPYYERYAVFGFGKYKNCFFEDAIPYGEPAYRTNKIKNLYRKNLINKIISIVNSTGYIQYEKYNRHYDGWYN